MNFIEELATYFYAKKAFEEYQPMAGEYSPWKAQLYERLSDAHIALDKAIDQRIDERIREAMAPRQYTYITDDAGRVIGAQVKEQA